MKVKVEKQENEFKPIKLEITIESEQELSELYNRFCRVKEFYPEKNISFARKGMGLGENTSDGMRRLAEEIETIAENYID